MPNTRFLAVESLSGILDQGGRPKQVLEALSFPLDRRDRSFRMEMAYGALRYRDTLDWIMGHFLKTPSKLGSFTRNNLRTALYQIFFMRVPDRAVVHEAVELEKGFSRGGKAPLVNAVLRNVLRRREEFTPPFSLDDPEAAIVLNTSHPMWLVRRWVERFGIEEAQRVAEANNDIPPLTLRVNTLRTGRQGLISMLGGKGIACRPTEYSPDGIILEGSRSYEDLSFAAGLFTVQDEASQLVTAMLAPQPGERILDACAAPGGKTTHMAQLMGDRGEIVAVEKSAERVGKMRENIEALGITSVRILTADVAELRDQEGFDRILMDAPCSATGVIRRNPDVKYRHSPIELQRFHSAQAALMTRVSRLLRPGGVLVYAVCSSEPEEGEEVIAGFLKTSGDFRIIDADAPFLRNFLRDGFMRTYPHRHKMDGFFGAALCKKG
jgi:16S rRNA (cytosine967-C5)-methyltransferase